MTPGRLITDADSAAAAERKAALAETAICEALRDHFQRISALIAYARLHGREREAASLYPAAFAPGQIPAHVSADFSTSTAADQAIAIYTAMAAGIHALDWEATSPPPQETELMRKSVAVLREDNSLDRLRDTGSHLRRFDELLSQESWLEEFIATNPSPLQAPPQTPQKHG